MRRRCHAPIVQAGCAPQPARVHCPARRRYGLIGPNGCGKSCLLKALGARDLPIPEHIDVYLLDREIPASDMTALEVRPPGRKPTCLRRRHVTGPMHALAFRAAAPRAGLPPAAGHPPACQLRVVPCSAQMQQLLGAGQSHDTGRDCLASRARGPRIRQRLSTPHPIPTPSHPHPTPLCRQAVMSVDAERARLEAEAEALAEQQGEEVEARLEDIYER